MRVLVLLLFSLQVCSAAKDGTCKVWDVTYTGKINLPSPAASADDRGDGAAESDLSRKPIADIPCCVDGIAGSGSVVTTKGVAAMQCRGCR